jgi:hypothetical protein
MDEQHVGHGQSRVSLGGPQVWTVGVTYKCGACRADMVLRGKAAIGRCDERISERIAGRKRNTCQPPECSERRGLDQKDEVGLNNTSMRNGPADVRFIYDGNR